MARFRPVVRFTNYPSSASRILNAGLAIHKLMVANALTFATPPLSMASFKTNLDDLADAIAAWGPVGNRGSKAQHQAMKSIQQIVHQNLVSLNNYVYTVASGDAYFIDQVATILSSGFANIKQAPIAPSFFVSPRSKHLPPTKKIAFLVASKATRTAGTVRLRWGKVKGAAGYIVLQSNSLTTPPTATINTSTASFYDVPPTWAGKYLWVQAINPNGLGSLSQPVQVPVV